MAKQRLIKRVRDLRYITASGKDEPIPESEIKRWVMLHDIKLYGVGFNREQLIKKMTAGFLLDPDTVKRFFVVEGVNLFQSGLDVVNEFKKRAVEEKRTLCEDELAMLKGFSAASESLVKMMETVIKISGSRTDTDRLPKLSLTDKSKPQEAPSFYAQINVNGVPQPNEKPVVIEQPVEVEK